jgi:hypothetical protein
MTAKTTTVSAIAMVSAASNNTVTTTESSTDRTESNTCTKQDEEGQIKKLIMMRRARGHFDKARVIRYSSITFWSFYLDPLKITKARYRDISLSRCFFSKKITLQQGLIITF